MNLNAFLLVDVGNTRVKWAVAHLPGFGPPNRPPVVAGEIATKSATVPRIRALAKKYSRHYLVLASVVPILTPIFARAFKGRCHLVTADSPALCLDFDYPKPAELGADRLAVCAAIATEGKFPAIVVSAGTATAFSALDAKGRFCGGAIAPGLRAQLDALVGAAAQLTATKLRAPKAFPARSTQDAIRAGVLLSFHGGVDETLRRLSSSLGARRPRIVLTGGDAALLDGSLTLPHSLRPLLIFEGLLIIGSRLFRAEPL
jgi:type III pantothenate kinase